MWDHKTFGDPTEVTKFLNQLSKRAFANNRKPQYHITTPYTSVGYCFVIFYYQD